MAFPTTKQYSRQAFSPSADNTPVLYFSVSGVTAHLGGEKIQGNRYTVHGLVSPLTLTFCHSQRTGPGKGFPSAAAFARASLNSPARLGSISRQLYPPSTQRMPRYGNTLTVGLNPP